MDKDLEPPHYKILNKAREMEREGKPVIHMEIGDPELSTDRRIIDAMYEAALKGYTHYGSAQGIPQIRIAISNYMSEKLNIEFTQDDICIVPGSKSAIYITLKTLGNKRERNRVVVLEPTWGIYYSFIRDLGYEALPIRLGMDNRWIPTKEDISKIEDSDFIVVINPSNPTGVVFNKEAVEMIVEKAMDNDSIIIADEIYFDLIYTSREFYSFFHTQYEKLVGLYSFSKTYAMTGFRLGWVLSKNKEFIRKITKGYQLLLTNVPEFIQFAGVRALELREIIDRNREVYRKRTRILSEGLKELGFKFIEPEAGFYIFTKVPEGFKDSIEFADKLLSQSYVAVAPGTAFGDYPGFVRFTTALKEETLREALERIKDFLGK